MIYMVQSSAPFINKKCKRYRKGNVSNNRSSQRIKARIFITEGLKSHKPGNYMQDEIKLVMAPKYLSLVYVWPEHRFKTRHLNRTLQNYGRKPKCRINYTLFFSKRFKKIDISTSGLSLF